MSGDKKMCECGEPVVYPGTGECQKCYRRRYYRENKDRCNAQSREWARNNREHVSALQRRRYWSDPESAKAKALEQQKRWMQTPEGAASRAATMKKYRASHIDKTALARREKREGAIRRQTPSPLPSNYRSVVLAHYGHKCLACSSTNSVQVDHVIPLALGGLHCLSNMQTLCAMCNAKKFLADTDYRNGDVIDD